MASVNKRRKVWSDGDLFLIPLGEKNMCSIKFEILIVSVPEKENLVAEVWAENQLIFDISKEAEDYIVEFFPTDPRLVFSYNEIVQALSDAKLKLG